MVASDTKFLLLPNPPNPMFEEILTVRNLHACAITLLLLFPLLSSFLRSFLFHHSLILFLLSFALARSPLPCSSNICLTPTRYLSLCKMARSGDMIIIVSVYSDVATWIFYTRSQSMTGNAGLVLFSPGSFHFAQLLSPFCAYRYFEFVSLWLSDVWRIYLFSTTTVQTM